MFQTKKYFNTIEQENIYKLVMVGKTWILLQSTETIYSRYHPESTSLSTVK